MNATPLLKSARRYTLAVVFGGAALLAACGGGPDASQSPTGGSVHGSREKSYDSLTELWADSGAVVEVMAQDSKIIYLGNRGSEVPFTATTAKVESVVASKVDRVPSSIVVRQLGTTDTPNDHGPPILQRGSRYLLYVSSADGTTVTDWYVTGAGAGAFAFGAEGATRLDPESPSLPAESTTAEVEASTR